jgi:tubulin polyglutamylase TTLL11
MKCTYPKDEPGKCFHILGVDVMLDSKGIPWILEINANPSFNIEASSESKKGAEPQISPIDLHVKSM